VSLVRVGLLAWLAVSLAFLLPTTAHGDFFISNFNSALIFTDHPNFYHALADEPTAVFPTGLSGGPYGPLFYYPTAAWLRALDWLHIIGMSDWAGTNDAALRAPGTILALKLPNLAVYALVAFVIAKTVKGEHGRFATWLWLANPAVILFTLMMGQNDGWTALASVAALYFALRAVEGRPVRLGGRELSSAAIAMLCLAAGAAIKLSPILLVPAFAWLLGAGAKERLLLTILGAGAFVLLIAPFLGSEYFWDYGLLRRQAGKATDVPNWSAALLYAGFLVAVWTASRNRADRRWAVIFAFVAFHGFFFLIGGWSPQRAVLFIAALAVTVHAQPWLLAPYLLTTGYSLFLALEHRSEIAAGLFEPMTSRALLVPPLLDGEVEPLHTILWALTGLAWIVGLALLWSRRKATLPERIDLLPVALAASLPIYLALSAVLLHRGVNETPYPAPAATQAVDTNERFAFAFISPQSDLQSISFWVESGSGPTAVRVVDGDDRTLFSQADINVLAGRNTIDVPRVEDAQGRWFVVRITPDEPLRVRMASLPRELAVAGAELNGQALDGTAAFTVHYGTSRTLLLAGARSHVVDHWPVLAASFVCCALLLFWVAWGITRDRNGNAA